MVGKAQKWGNSLAVRLPRAMAREVGVADNDEVDIRVVRGRIVIAPLARPGYTLAALVSQIADENLHEEVADAGPVGLEQL